MTELRSPANSTSICMIISVYVNCDILTNSAKKMLTSAVFFGDDIIMNLANNISIKYHQLLVIKITAKFYLTSHITLGAIV
jgi:hypothetical protein